MQVASCKVTRYKCRPLGRAAGAAQIGERRHLQVTKLQVTKLQVTKLQVTKLQVTKPRSASAATSKR